MVEELVISAKPFVRLRVIIGDATYLFQQLSVPATLETD